MPHFAGPAQAAAYTPTWRGDLPAGTNRSTATGIDKSRQVVGRGHATTGQPAFLWDSGAMTELGNLVGERDQSHA
jgi:probable HAF family extracellular repeat protein